MSITVTVTTSDVVNLTDVPREQTLLEIVQEIAKNTGYDVPDAAFSNTDREIVNIVQFTVEAAREVARRVDWDSMRSITAAVGTGTATAFDLPYNFSRLIQGQAVEYNGSPVRGGLSQSEFLALVPVEGAPRFYLVGGKQIQFYPYMPAGGEAVISYQTRDWNISGTNEWTADDDYPVFPSSLIVKGALWRWRRHMGMDFSDYLAEFEAALKDYGAFEGHSRA